MGKIPNGVGKTMSKNYEKTKQNIEELIKENNGELSTRMFSHMGKVAMRELIKERKVVKAEGKLIWIYFPETYDKMMVKTKLVSAYMEDYFDELEAHAQAQLKSHEARIKKLEDEKSAVNTFKVEYSKCQSCGCYYKYEDGKFNCPSCESGNKAARDLLHLQAKVAKLKEIAKDFIVTFKKSESDIIKAKVATWDYVLWKVNK